MTIKKYLEETIETAKEKFVIGMSSSRTEEKTYLRLFDYCHELLFALDEDFNEITPTSLMTVINNQLATLENERATINKVYSFLESLNTVFELGVDQ